MKTEYENLVIKDSEIIEMNQIFEQISNKYKNESDEYLLKSVLDAKLEEFMCKGKKKDEIQEGISFVFDSFFSYIEKGDKKIFINFLVKANFIDDKKKKNFLFGFVALII